jgi:hypothetical protein
MPKLRSMDEDERMEVEVGLCLHKIMDLRQHLAEILDRYHVDNPHQIKELIAKGKIEGHPAYEDYLDALSLKMGIEELLKRLDKSIEMIKSTL